MNKLTKKLLIIATIDSFFLIIGSLTYALNSDFQYISKEIHYSIITICVIVVVVLSFISIKIRNTRYKISYESVIKCTENYIEQKKTEQ
jgi:uncharacterized membrane protein YdbT with pleckstrin-like domain